MSVVAEPVQPAGRSTPPAAARPSPLRVNLNLTRELAVTSFKLKYTGSTLGYAWSLVKPLLIFGMTYAVFVQVLKAGRGDPSFPVELLVGIVLWTFFADATSSAVGAIVANGQIIRKAYFPRWIVVVASTLSATMTLAVNLALVLLIGLPLGWFHVGLQTLLVPLLFVELYILVVGIGLLMSALFVFYSDLGHVWEILLQLLFYASAILFPLTLITRYRPLRRHEPDRADHGGHAPGPDHPGDPVVVVDPRMAHRRSMPDRVRIPGASGTWCSTARAHDSPRPCDRARHPRRRGEQAFSDPARPQHHPQVPGHSPAQQLAVS